MVLSHSGQLSLLPLAGCKMSTDLENNGTVGLALHRQRIIDLWHIHM